MGLGLGSNTVVTCLIRTVRPTVCASVRELGLGSKTVVVYWGMQAEPRACWFVKFIDMKVNDWMRCHSSEYIYFLFCCKWSLCRRLHRVAILNEALLLSCIIDMFYITLQTPTAVYVRDMCIFLNKLLPTSPYLETSSKGDPSEVVPLSISQNS